MGFKRLQSMISTEDELQEQKKYHAARFVWKRRRNRTPNKQVMWQAWFEKMFGENLDDYAKRKAKEKND